MSTIFRLQTMVNCRCYLDGGGAFQDFGEADFWTLQMLGEDQSISRRGRSSRLDQAIFSELRVQGLGTRFQHRSTARGSIDPPLLRVMAYAWISFNITVLELKGPATLEKAVLDTERVEETCLLWVSASSTSFTCAAKLTKSNFSRDVLSATSFGRYTRGTSGKERIRMQCLDVHTSRNCLRKFKDL